LQVAGVTWAWTQAGWQRVERPVPRARLVSDWRTAGAATPVDRSIDVERTAIVDAPVEIARGGGSHVTRLRDEPGRLSIETVVDVPQLLVLTERYHAGWRAAIGDEPVAVRRVYGEYLGCVVPAGRQRVSFVFAPASARYGWWLTIGGLAATLLCAWAVRRSA
jgi:hypothetical protein